MVNFLRSLWENFYGLFVDDGQIAVGTLAALAAVGAWAALAGANTAMRDLGGPILFALLMALLLVNLNTAGKNAARKRLQD